VIVYGRNPVREALRGRREVRRVLITAGALRDLEPLGEVTLERVASDAELTGLCGSDDHQGVCAEVEEYPYVDAAETLADPEGLVVCLDEVQDPRNLGAVCRVAECAGASGVVIPERRSATVTPVVCRASAGAVEHIAVARVRNLTEFLNQAKRAGAWIYGAHAAAEVAYDEPDYGGRVVLVLGSEGRGLRPRVIGACDQLVALPVRGRIGSLNVAAAAAALVYGILQAREQSA
jgi:23S rRNA (guanosine2251-2'-O)-methyltransferase